MTTGASEVSDWLEAVRFDADGLVTAVTRDVTSGRVLMVAWMNREALALTRREGRAVYWSRSRGRLWRKGEQSGHVQWVREIRLDCDGDTLLLSVEQVGGVACHTGREHCFYRRLDEAGHWVTTDTVRVDPQALYGEQPAVATEQRAVAPEQTLGRVLSALDATLAARRTAAADSSYVAGLHARGLDAILKKVGEEAAETIIAAKSPRAAGLVHEVADLWFHTLVLLSHLGLGADAILGELERRAGVSGLAEKASRGADPGPG